MRSLCSNKSLHTWSWHTHVRFVASVQNMYVALTDRLDTRSTLRSRTNARAQHTKAKDAEL